MSVSYHCIMTAASIVIIVIIIVIIFQKSEIKNDHFLLGSGRDVRGREKEREIREGKTRKRKGISDLLFLNLEDKKEEMEELRI